MPAVQPHIVAAPHRQGGRCRKERTGGVKCQKKVKKKQEENENAGFTMMLFYFSGLAGGRRDWMK